MDRVGVPDPGPDRIRVIVHACGLNPADWALCRGLFSVCCPAASGWSCPGPSIRSDRAWPTSPPAILSWARPTTPVTSYGDGLAGRVTVAAGGPVDLVLDTAPPCGALPDLIQAADGDPRRVLTVSDFAAAAELGVRDSFHEDPTPRHDVLDEFAKLAADGQFTIPVARTFPLEDWRTALGISQSGHARGRLVLLPAGTEVVS
jgi:Zinc-binding dehydrogenase